MAEIDTLLVCDCEGSMRLDPEALRRAAGARRVRACTALCTTQAAAARDALAGGETLIACAQEAGRFRELAEDLDVAGRLRVADIRDRAGWSADAPATPKQAALLAEAALPAVPTPVTDVTSDGVCLVIGDGEAAFDAARRLSGALAVTLLLSAAPEDLSPADLRGEAGDGAGDGGEIAVALGRVAAASGALGGFEVTVNGYAELAPGGRGALGFGAARDGARSRCDILLDLSGGAALFPAPGKRDGYLRADPRDPAAAARAAFDAAQMVGVFEKPLHVRLDAALCAHSRAGQAGCSRCLDMCPAGAILPAGDAVAVDPAICAGCGACAAVCPSGAVSHDAPPVEHLFLRLRTLAAAYRAAGGDAPRALFHDGFGAGMIALSARFGRGLPADVIPVQTSNVEGVGHAELLAALGCGFGAALVLAGPRTDRAALDGQLAIARALVSGALGEDDAGGAGARRIALLDPAEPEALEAALCDAPRPAPHGAAPILPLGGRREVTRLVVSALAAAGGADGRPPIPLPEGAPYGAVAVDAQACTLCLACVSLCPVGALGDNAERPQLRFQEAACLQCGICAAACPEDAIRLIPQLDAGAAALAPVVLHEEEPFACIECGKLFGVRSTIERISEKLSGKHWMFTESDNSRLIRMCDDCRVRAQFQVGDSPFAMGERPRTRTTDDYLNGDGDS